VAAANSSWGSTLGSVVKRSLQVYSLVECAFFFYHRYQLWRLQKHNTPVCRPLSCSLQVKNQSNPKLVFSAPQPPLTDEERDRHLERMIEANAITNQDHGLYLSHWYPPHCSPSPPSFFLSCSANWS
jgi:hypothetical protein